MTNVEPHPDLTRQLIEFNRNMARMAEAQHGGTRGGGDDGRTEARITKLEDAVVNIRERLSNIEAALKALPGYPGLITVVALIVGAVATGSAVYINANFTRIDGRIDRVEEQLRGIRDSTTRHEETLKNIQATLGRIDSRLAASIPSGQIGPITSRTDDQHGTGSGPITGTNPGTGSNPGTRRNPGDLKSGMYTAARVRGDIVFNFDGSSLGVIERVAQGPDQQIYAIVQEPNSLDHRVAIPFTSLAEIGRGAFKVASSIKPIENPGHAEYPSIPETTEFSGNR